MSNENGWFNRINRIDSKDTFAHGKLCKARKNSIPGEQSFDIGRIEKLIRGKDSDVAMDHRTRNLEKLVRYKGPGDASDEERSSTLEKFKKYLKYIIYKQVGHCLMQGV